MKDLNIYQQLQFAVLVVFFAAFIVCFTLVIIQPEPTDTVSSLFNELKTLFLAILSVETLKRAIAKSNGDETPTQEGEKS